LLALPFTFSVGRAHEAARQDGGFGLIYAVGGPIPSRLALKWSEKRKIMIGLSRIVMTTGCPTPDIMCPGGSEMLGLP
jgi:hypothetical protein